ncbi:MAG: 2-dehydropantoate 2-reductase [Candidatus Omnitrophica bacterium]|nr:2-dehydropantoate 2-reductase [Candidatus Omnitrophota bacterium]
MKITVIGAGAIGGLVAGYLKLKGQDVSLVAHADSVKAVEENGLHISGAKGQHNIKIPISEKLSYKPDLIILATKTQDIEEALKSNQAYIKDAIILTIQNGVASEELVAKYAPKENIVSSIVMFGATRLEPGRIAHNFEGPWIIGSAFGKNDDTLKQLFATLSVAFNVRLADDIQGMKYLKLFINANNCIPAILGVSIQKAFSDINVSCVAMQIWKEGWEIVNKGGIKLVSLPDFPLERLTKLVSLPAVQSAGIYSGIMTTLSKEPLYGSVLQSIKRGRPSEIDYLNGEFVRLAEKYGLDAPLNKKMVEMVHEVEKNRKFFSREEFFREINGLAEIVENKVIDSPFPRLKLSVVNVGGHCYHGYKVGDELILEDFTHPPKYFCLGLAHAVFPAAYALSFGAKFPFMENQQTLKVTCPDGGKLEFKVEVLDNKGKAQFSPKDPNYKGPKPKKMLIEVVRSDGTCHFGYKVGDKWGTEGLKCIPGFCGAAFHCAFPALFALNFGAKFFFMPNQNSIDTVTCPDGGKVVFKLTRIEE